MNRSMGLVGVLFIVAATDAGIVNADDFHRDAVRRATEKGLVILERGAKAYPSHESCFSCHHQTLSMLAMTEASKAGIRFDSELMHEQATFTRKSFDERKGRLSKGEHVGGRAATVSYGLWTFQLAGDSPDELSEAMTGYLLSVQQPDGRWKPPSNRPPLEESPISCTVLSAIGIKRFASQAQEGRVAEAIERATTWLSTAPLNDQEDLNFAMWGEILLGGTPERAATLINRIRDARQADGGWSQITALNSDAYATGQTLFVLMESGLGVDEACIREGVAYLIETQHDDGSWHVVSRSKPIQPWFDNGDPHDKDQFISFTATGWATAALARSLRPTSKVGPSAEKTQ